MSNTPGNGRRVSLRRKRGPRDERGDSPLSKRVSPSVEERINPELPEVKEFRTKKNFSQKMAAVSHPPSTPKNRVNAEEESVHFSPDTPLMCSQIMGTQECEVVWDCNSPGFSKEDLKRMCNGDDASPIPIMPPPQRALFPLALRNRSVSGQMTSSGKSSQAALVAAQLDALLQNIPNKDKSLEKSLDDILSESASPEMDNSYGVSTSLLEELTQPFQISGVEEVDEEDNSSKKFIANDKKLNKSMSKEEDMEINSPKSFEHNIRARSSVTSVPSMSESMTEDMNMSSLEMNTAITDVSSMSADIFDDDLFNDSVIRTTQAVEAATFDIRKASKSTPINVNLKNKKLSSASSDEGVGPSQASTVSAVDHGSSPILGKFRSPENLPPRRIRNTFRLNTFDSPDIMKEDTSRNSLKQNSLSNQASVNNNVTNNFNVNKPRLSKGDNLKIEDSITEKKMVNDKRFLSNNVKSEMGINVNKISGSKVNTSTLVSKDSNIMFDNKVVSEKSNIANINQHSKSQVDKFNPRINQETKFGCQNISNVSQQQTRFIYPQKQSNMHNKNDGNKMPRSKSTNNAFIASSSSSSSLRRFNSTDTPSPKCSLADRFNSAVTDFQLKEFEDDDDFFATVLEDDFSNTTIDTISSSIPNKKEDSKMSLFEKNLKPIKNFPGRGPLSNKITDPSPVFENTKQVNKFSVKNLTINSSKEGFKFAAMTSGQVLKGDKSSPKKNLQVTSHTSNSVVSRVLIPTSSDMLDDDDDLFQDDVLTAIEEVE
ncbi:unnamed protein product, partial [Meganyctiphanes norvegica]